MSLFEKLFKKTKLFEDIHIKLSIILHLIEKISFSVYKILIKFQSGEN